MDNTGNGNTGPTSVTPEELPRIGPNRSTLQRQHNERVLLAKDKQDALRAAQAAGGTPNEVNMESELKQVLLAMVSSQKKIGTALLELIQKTETIDQRIIALEGSAVEELRFLSEVVLTAPK